MVIATQRYFSTTEAARLLDVKYVTFDSWLRKGLITSEVSAEGLRTARGFSLRDLVFGGLVAKLKKFNVSSKVVREAAQLARSSWSVGNMGLIVVINDSVFWFEERESSVSTPLDKALRPVDGVLFILYISLSTLAENVVEKLEASEVTDAPVPV